MLSERRRRRERAQRGSVLSSVLIIVAFLAILGGALMNEVTTQFILSHTHAARVADEATVNSSVEYAIGQLQTRTVPAHCSTDTGPKWSVNLNSQWATAVPTCQAIVPDRATPLTAGTFSADGTHVVIQNVRNTYLVGDSSGNVYNYRFGQTAFLWRVGLGAGVTAPPAQTRDVGRNNHLITLVPTGSSVALIDDNLVGSATLRCTMAATGTVTTQPGVENAPSSSSAFFPDYAFFSDSSGRLSVYDATTNGNCARLARVSGVGTVVGGPLVLTGTKVTNRNQNGEGNGEQDTTTSSVEVFVIVNGGGSSHLVQYEYSEVTSGSGGPNPSLTFVASQTLPVGNVSGADYSTVTPANGQSIRLALTSGSGQVAMPSIRARNARGNQVSGLTYTMSGGPSPANLGGSFNRAPYWCLCPSGDLIGAGNQNGTLYVLDGANLNLRLRYDGSAADGRPRINSTPGADANGNWYFGADDGFVYDVEAPASGTAMFKAARFGPGGSVRSSPIVGGTSDGCVPGTCMYFGSTGTDYFAQLGGLRLMNVTACRTAGSGLTACVGNPRLWARLEVGTPGILGGQDVHVIQWSYYSP